MVTNGALRIKSMVTGKEEMSHNLSWHFKTLKK